MLRQKGARIEKITAEIKALITDMIETMNDSNGVGLAAQQVGHALQLTVLDVREATNRPSTLQVDGREVAPEDYMPMVLINPHLKLFDEPASGPEGCLSFPEMFASIVRPGMTEVRALNEHGKEIEFKCGGLLARAIQHEYDHLQGILFIDRMAKADKEELKEQLEELQAKTKAELKKKK